MSPDKKTYSHLVFIGRFQPLHNAHLHIMRKALGYAENLIIFVGSSNSARCPRNPFTFQERKAMIEGSLVKEVSPMIMDRVTILPLNDYTYNDPKWVATIQKQVHDIAGYGYRSKIGLVGYAKDSSSYYLKKFPFWSSVGVETTDEILNSTDIRHRFFNDNYDSTFDVCPSNVNYFLDRFRQTEVWEGLKDWTQFDKDYKKIWAEAPYPVIIPCVDSLVTQSGHILLVTRKGVNGKGLLALPGGHVNPDETFLNAAIRELREETHISDEKGEIPPAMLESYIDDSKTRLYDDPHRSSRARVTTNVFQFNLPERTKLFKVRGDDDAEKAQWYPLGSLKANLFFEDHAHMIMNQLNLDF